MIIIHPFEIINMEYLWIFAAIFAAGCQTARSAFQKTDTTAWRLRGSLHKILLCLTFYFFDMVDSKYIENSIPDLSFYSIFLCFLGSIFQILYICFNEGFSHKSFAAGIAFSKTEVILIAFLEVIILNNFFISTHNRYNTWCSICPFILCKKG